MIPQETANDQDPAMCLNCFFSYTPKPVITPDVQTIALILGHYDDEIEYSSFLHTICEDYNVDDWHFTDSHRDDWGAPQDWERVIFDRLKALTPAQRVTALAIRDNMFTIVGKPTEWAVTFDRELDEEPNGPLLARLHLGGPHG